MTTRLQIEREAIRHALLFPDVYRTYLDLYAVPRTAAQLEERQAERLSALLDRILVQVPAFRHLQVRRTGDPFELLGTLPTMSKANILADLASHVADDLDPTSCASVLTSGTTGEPLRIIHSHEHLIHGAASSLERFLGYGLPFDRKTLQPFRKGAGRWREYTSIGAGFNRVGGFGFLDDATPAERLTVARRCEAFAPDLLINHPPRLLDFADLLADAGVELRVPLIRTFGVTLTDTARELLAKAFGGVVRDQYAMSETNMIAAECGDGRLHVDADRVLVEILDQDDKPVPAGQAGEVTVTNLFNAVMPFVRYRTGDVAALDHEACSCGRQTPVLRLLGGRDYGVIEFTDGTSIQGLRVVRALEGLPLRQVQVIQQEASLLTVLIAPLPTRPDWREPVTTAVRQVVGSRIGVDVLEAGPDDFVRPGGDKLVSFVALNDRRQPAAGTAESTAKEVPDVQTGADRTGRRDAHDERAGAALITRGPGR